MGKKVIYIAGAISGSPQNRVDIESAAKEIEARGFIPLSPACLPEGLCDRKLAQLCTAMINSSDAVLLLHNWAADKSSTLAKRYCEYAEKLSSHRLDTLVTVLLEK